MPLENTRCSSRIATWDKLAVIEKSWKFCNVLTIHFCFVSETFNRASRRKNRVLSTCCSNNPEEIHPCMIHCVIALQMHELLVGVLMQLHPYDMHTNARQELPLNRQNPKSTLRSSSAQIQWSSPWFDKRGRERTDAKPRRWGLRSHFCVCFTHTLKWNFYSTKCSCKSS